MFTGILMLVIDERYGTLDASFVDDTQVEANANRSTYVWKKNVEGHKDKLEAAMRELLKHIETVVQSENAEYGDRDLPAGEPQPLTTEALAAELTPCEDRCGRNRSRMSRDPPISANF